MVNAIVGGDKIRKITGLIRGGGGCIIQGVD